MAPCFDSVTSNLICGEDDGVFDDTDCYNDVVRGFESSWYSRNLRNHEETGCFDEGFPYLSEDCLSLMIEKECHHMPCSDYLNRLRIGDLDLTARKEAIDWIDKVHAHYGFGPLCAYLSINYLDRFMSIYELPKGKAWMMQLLAVACLSIGVKMEETNAPLSLDLQVGGSKFVFEARTIQRMELLVLTTLKWRMQAITPFSFIDSFLHKINGESRTLIKSANLRAIQLILSTSKGIEFLEFKQSEVAAAVAISIAEETIGMDTHKAMSHLAQHIQKERVMKCMKVMHDLSMINYSGCLNKKDGASLPLALALPSSSTSMPQSPIGVLDAAACLSYKSDDITVGSCPTSSHQDIITPDAKRRKINNRPPYPLDL